MTLPANFRGARGRRKLENHCPGLQGVLLLVLLTTSTGRLVCRLAVPCFREETWPASGNCMSINSASRLQEVSINRARSLWMKEDVLFHTQFMKLGEATRSWPARNEAELLPPATSSARQFHDSGANCVSESVNQTSEWAL